MEAKRLRGCYALVVEHEPLIALDLQKLLEEGGAQVITAIRHDEALRLAATPGLNIATLDYTIATEEGDALCTYLKSQNIPFLFYSGASREMMRAWFDVPFIGKPALAGTIIDTVESVFARDRQRLGARALIDHL